MNFISSRVMRLAATVIVATVLSLSASSCSLTKNQLEYDRAGEKDRQVYRDALAPIPLPEENDDADIPAFQPVVATPDDLRLPAPLVTVSVNQTVSLRDLLFELADQADVDLELDPQIRGSIIFTAKDRPFDQVVDRICEMAGLRYKYDSNVLRVEVDRPFVRNYSVDYINASRSGEAQISTDIKLASTGGESGSAGGGSSSGISTKMENDLWGELTSNLEQLLTSSDTYMSLATMADPVSTPVAPPMPVSSDPNNPVPPALPGSAGVAPIPGSVAPTLNVSVGSSEPAIPSPPATYSISKQTGVLSVYASQRQHKLVEKFLNDFRKRAGTQILIEAKVLQVDLSDQFSTGVDWSDLDLTGLVKLSLNAPIQDTTPVSGSTFTAIINGGNSFNATIEAISRFGTVRALSSPRVTVLNNQPAIVNVAQNKVYFEFEVDLEPGQDNNPPTIAINSEQKSVPEGVLMTVMPSANPDTGEIQLVVRPTVSKITSFVEDPTITLTAATSGIDLNNVQLPTNQIPEVSLQEIDSTIKMQSGQMMVMGGLMRDNNSVTETGVPVLGDLPLVGHAFKRHIDRIEKSELIILIRATIVPGLNADEADRKIYKTFAEDRRPAKL